MRFARELKVKEFAAREVLAGCDARQLAREILRMTQEEFSAAFKSSPMKRTKLRGLKRNAAVVLGNLDAASHAESAEDAEVLTRALDDAESLVRDHAAWALEQIGPRLISTGRQRSAACALHAPDADTLLVLPNAWDAMSARLVEEAGARAIATTSAGISWALGYPDGQGLSRDAMAAAVRTIVRAVSVPVSADVESGYGDGTPADAAATARAVIEAGAVGINLEDAPGANGSVLVDVEQQAARIAAARAAADAAGVDLFINARTDVMLRKVGDEGRRFEETVRRARAYVAAGADGVFVPGVADADTVRRLAAAVGVPLNVIGGPGVPAVPELRALGVARVSVGPGLVRAIMAQVRAAAKELLGPGTYDSLREQVTSPEANALFARRAG